MAIGNQYSKIRQMPPWHSVVVVALLEIEKNKCNIPQKRLDQQRETNREVLNKVRRRVLEPHTFQEKTSAERGYYNVLSADGNFRHCKSVLAA